MLEPPPPTIIPAVVPAPTKTNRLTPEPPSRSPAVWKSSVLIVGLLVSFTSTVPSALIVNVRSTVQAEKSSTSLAPSGVGSVWPKLSAKSCVVTLVIAPVPALVAAPVPPKTSVTETRTLSMAPMSADVTVWLLAVAPSIATPLRCH